MNPEGKKIPLAVDSMASFEKEIMERCGLVFGGELREKLFGSIAQRMSATGEWDPSSYFNHLLNHEAEFHALIGLITNNETYFFRESGQFSIIMDYLVPQWIDRHGDKKQIKILSAGCSSGDEPYSIAIDLLESFGTEKKDLFNIIGVDIDHKSLAKARAGVYTSGSFRNNLSPNITKYFTPLGHNQRVLDKRVREMVSFAQLNLCQASYPAFMNGMDIVLFRNVSIYFSAETRLSIFNKLSSLLRPGGVIFLSATEVFHHSYMLHSDSDICLEQWGDFFFFRRRFANDLLDTHPVTLGTDPIPAIDGQRSLLPPHPGTGNGHRLDTQLSGTRATDCFTRMLEPRSENQTRDLFAKALSHAKNGQYDVALDTLKQNSSTTNNPNVLALEACILLNVGKYHEVEALCCRILDQEMFHPEAHLIFGIAANKLSRYSDSISYLKKSVYSQPDCWLPHFHLAEVYYTIGEQRQGCREYQVVLHLLEKEGAFQRHGLPFFDSSFSVADMIHLCVVKQQTLGCSKRVLLPGAS
ncbi:MAG: MCP methyltransferase, CheR-type [Magnetococcales bacterium]|nr:MCP methyltransferase, CheR-type [Magnetococcales bacterium]